MSFRERYFALAHKLQSAIAFNPNKKILEPKHLRVGIDCRAADQRGLAILLIEKGVFTQDEYDEAMMKGMELEVEDQRRHLETVLGTKVTLG